MPRPMIVLGLLAALSAALVAAGLGACKRKGRDAGAGRVTLVYTGGVHGALEPCGCSPGQLGGVAREATLLKEIRRENPDAILVDAGDLLLQDPEAPESIRPQLTLKAKFMQKAYGAMRASVLNLGGKDVAAGTDVAVSGAKAIGAAPISANLLDAGGKLLAPGSAVIEAGGVRVAFVGAADPAPLPAGIGSAIRVDAPLDRVRAAVEEVRPRADVVVLLSTLGLDAAHDLAMKIPGIDFVIDTGEGKDPRNIVIPLKAGDARLVSVKPLGEFVGRIDVALDAGKTGLLRDATTSDRIEGMPVEGAASGTLFGGGLDLRGVSRKRAKASAKLPPLAPGTFRHRVYALGDTFTKDAAMQQLLVDYKRQVTVLVKSLPVAQSRIPTDGPHYLGQESCKACHRAIYEYVQTLPHAKAFATLERVKSSYDLECIGCHVTGWQTPGGFDQPGAVGNLKDVQCESCHGPGSEHVKTGGRGEAARLKADVPVGLCATCHTPAHSTRFAGKQAIYMDRIRCSRAPERVGGGDGAGPPAGTRSTRPDAAPPL